MPCIYNRPECLQIFMLQHFKAIFKLVNRKKNKGKLDEIVQQNNDHQSIYVSC